MRHHGTALLERLLDDGSHLVAAGLLDEAEVRSACRAFTATGDRIYEVYRPLMLEAGLRSLTRPGRSVSALVGPAAVPRAGT
jgi:hypothetical protein